MTQSAPQFFDEPPPGQGLTPYDREHMVLYLRLLDAARDGAVGGKPCKFCSTSIPISIRNAVASSTILIWPARAGCANAAIGNSSARAKGTDAAMPPRHRPLPSKGLPEINFSEKSCSPRN